MTLDNAASVKWLSVFTPSHDPRFLGDCYDSLAAQTFTDWEWVVVLNRGATWRAPADDRVRVVVDNDLDGVGAAKARACAECRGDVLVELDHDDLLAPHALELVAEAFAGRPGLALVYSHCAQVAEDGRPDYSVYDKTMGWKYRHGEFPYPVSFEATPHNVCHIWFAPNHLRAFSADAYKRAGGYDPARKVLDDQDLMCRLYRVGPFALIDRCLYFQRLHAANTWRQDGTNAFIQTETLELYGAYIESCALAWADREQLAAIDLGAAHAKAPGYLGVDRRPAAGVDIVAALPRLPFDDDEVGVVRAMDFLEHVSDKVALWDELYRILAPGGLCLTMTPSTDGRGAFQDPTHCAYYNENSFWYLTDPAYAAYVPEQKARFQVSRLFTGFPSDWHLEHGISYVTANLIALKDGAPRNGGPVAWP